MDRLRSREARRGRRGAVAGLASAALLAHAGGALAQPTVVDPGLVVERVAAPGLAAATGLRFLGPDDFFAIEKNTGKVKRVHGGVVDEVLDLSVATDAERGLLGIELHPEFATNGLVYLFHSTRSLPGDGSGAASWVENRLDRYVWDGTSLAPDPSFQTFSIGADAAQSNGPNHDGGVLRFGPDGTLYLATGDLNRSRIEQNAPGATASAGSGGIYRLNADGTLPADNPFAGHANADLHGLFAYGVRNSFGLAIDPVTGRLWDTENGPNRMDEINQVSPGFNSGWSILMGPESRDPEGEDRNDLIDLLMESSYSDPEFSFAAPIGITSLAFLAGSALGAGYDDAVVVGDVVTATLYLLRLDASREGFALADALADLVADGTAERELLRFGSGFGGATGLEIGPDGALYVLPFAGGQIWRIAAIPEPASAALLALGLAVLALRRRPTRSRC